MTLEWHSRTNDQLTVSLTRHRASNSVTRLRPQARLGFS